MSKVLFVPVDSERIRLLLKERKKTKSQMALDLSISREHLYRQLGKKRLSFKWLQMIADYLGVEKTYLTGEQQKKYNLAGIPTDVLFDELMVRCDYIIRGNLIVFERQNDEN